jgi:phosphatidylglycerophosphate synthase
VEKHIREHRSLLAAPEKRLLIAIARRLPPWINSDHLTLLALTAMAVAGVGYALIGWDLRARWLVVAALAVNWFGDSLDGTVARVRQTERPRYGFYVDHVVDIAGSALLFAGLAASPFMSAPIALAVLVAYLLVSAEVYLATAVHYVFRMSFAGVGPTELRILMATGTMMLPGDPRVNLGPLGQWQLFDVGGLVAAAGLLVAFAASVVRNTRDLARLEPPKAQAPSRPPQHRRTAAA